jgi:hypothetical protein
VDSQIAWLEARAKELAAAGDAHGTLESLAERVFAEPLELP